jgi:hypothetical protein
MDRQPTRLPGPFFRFITTTGPVKRRYKTKAAGVTTHMDEAVAIVEKERHLDCPKYEECLDQAAAENWSGFTCINCPRRGA